MSTILLSIHRVLIGHAGPLLLATLLAGCGSSGPSSPATVPRRAAVDVPDHFLVVEGSETVEPSDASCRSPMTDPRDGSRLVLVRSSAGTGDYEVPPGRYGVEADEVLRLDCATGRPIGIFARPR